MTKRFLVTGGAGFIGSALVRHLIDNSPHSVLAVDKITYAANLMSLSTVKSSARYQFAHLDICDIDGLNRLFDTFMPNVVVHLAAETHVDRSIDGPATFVETNIRGTFVLLQAALRHYQSLSRTKRSEFRFHHVSTDEVFGSLDPKIRCTESSQYSPSSPYAATKAASDHLVHAWHRTFGLPAVISICSNNYGPRQFPEKLIPLTILNCAECKKLLVYGDGLHVRDWVYVDDHVKALMLVADKGVIGRTYAVGGDKEWTNIAVIKTICSLMDELAPNRQIGKHEALIRFDVDRPGHDRRHAIEARRISEELGWKPIETLKTGLRKTVEWYLANPTWWEHARSRVYTGQRLGL